METTKQSQGCPLEKQVTSQNVDNFLMLCGYPITVIHAIKKGNYSANMYGSRYNLKRFWNEHVLDSRIVT